MSKIGVDYRIELEWNTYKEENYEEENYEEEIFNHGVTLCFINNLTNTMFIKLNACLFHYKQLNLYSIITAYKLKKMLMDDMELFREIPSDMNDFLDKLEKKLISNNIFAPRLKSLLISNNMNDNDKFVKIKQTIQNIISINNSYIIYLDNCDEKYLSKEDDKLIIQFGYASYYSNIRVELDYTDEIYECLIKINDKIKEIN